MGLHCHPCDGRGSATLLSTILRLTMGVSNWSASFNDPVISFIVLGLDVASSFGSYR
jgi:hypothetical protein